MSLPQRALLLAGAAIVGLGAGPARADEPAEADDAVGFGDLPVASEPSPARASDDDDDVGFGDLPSSTAASPDDTEAPGDPGAWSAFGFARFDGGAAYEREGASALQLARATLQASAKYRSPHWAFVAGVRAESDAATVLDPERRDGVEREVYGQRAMPWEVYGEARFEHGTVSFGRRILGLGHAKLFPTLDLANPRDERMPLLGFPAENRMPVWMTRLLLYGGAHSLQLVAVHESNYRFGPPPLGHYSVLPALLRARDPEAAKQVLAPLEQRDVAYAHDLDGFMPAYGQLIGHYRFVASAAELELFGGWVADPVGVVALPAAADFEADPIPLRTRHRHYALAGASLLTTVDAFVLFAEGVAELGRPVTVGGLDEAPFELALGRVHGVRGTLGARFDGIRDGSLSFELSGGRQLRLLAPGALSPIAPVTPLHLGATYRKRWRRDRVELELFAAVLGPRFRGGQAVRSQLGYRLRDTLLIRVAHVAFWPGSELGPIAGYERHDRVDLRLQWDFSALH